MLSSLLKKKKNNLQWKYEIYPSHLLQSRLEHPRRRCNCSCFCECWQRKAGQRPELVSAGINCQQTVVLFYSTLRIEHSQHKRGCTGTFDTADSVSWSLITYILRRQRNGHQSRALVSFPVDLQSIPSTHEEAHNYLGYPAPSSDLCGTRRSLHTHKCK